MKIAMKSAIGFDALAAAPSRGSGTGWPVVVDAAGGAVRLEPLSSRRVNAATVHTIGAAAGSPSLPQPNQDRTAALTPIGSAGAAATAGDGAASAGSSALSALAAGDGVVARRRPPGSTAATTASSASSTAAGPRGWSGLPPAGDSAASSGTAAAAASSGTAAAAECRPGLSAPAPARAPSGSVPSADRDCGSAVRVTVSAGRALRGGPGSARRPADLDVWAGEPVLVAALSEELPDEPADPVVSATAMTGIATTAAPTPKATASAPTRPMARPAVCGARRADTAAEG